MRLSAYWSLWLIRVPAILASILGIGLMFAGRRGVTAFSDGASSSRDALLAASGLMFWSGALILILRIILLALLHLELRDIAGRPRK
jgi:hypothetical protein